MYKRHTYRDTDNQWSTRNLRPEVVWYKIMAGFCILYQFRGCYNYLGFPLGVRINVETRIESYRHFLTGCVNLREIHSFTHVDTRKENKKIEKNVAKTLQIFDEDLIICKRDISWNGTTKTHNEILLPGFWISSWILSVNSGYNAEPQAIHSSSS